MLENLSAKINGTPEINVLYQEISKLPPIIARVLILHYEEEKSFKQLCAILNRSLSSVRNYHSRGIFLLQRQLEKDKE